MNNVFYIAVLFLVVCSCAEIKKENVRIQINIPHSNYQYVQGAIVQNENNDTLQVDSTPSFLPEHCTGYFWDSLSCGNYSIRAFSLLSDDYVQHINLQRDTIIMLDSSSYKAFEIADCNSFSNTEIHDIDTIFIGYKISSCFSDRSEKIKLYKSGNKYQVIYTKADWMRIETSASVISEDVYKKNFDDLIKSCYKKYSDQKNPRYITIVSTLQQRLYIRHKGIIYEIPENSDDSYQLFKRAIHVLQ